MNKSFHRKQGQYQGRRGGSVESHPKKSSSVVVFHRESNGCQITLPVCRITSIDISMNNGSTMVCTRDGVVVVSETFEETVSRFSSCGGDPVVFYKDVNGEPIAIPLDLIERIEMSELAECQTTTVVITQGGRICTCDEIGDAVAAANEAGGRLCTFHKTLDGGRITNIPARKIKSIEVSSKDNVTVVRVGESRIVINETLEEATRIFEKELS